jgi:hypothetical protein
VKGKLYSVHIGHIGIKTSVNQSVFCVWFKKIKIKIIRKLVYIYEKRKVLMG